MTACVFGRSAKAITANVSMARDRMLVFIDVKCRKSVAALSRGNVENATSGPERFRDDFGRAEVRTV